MSIRIVFGRLHKHGQHPSPDKGDDGVDDERSATNTSDRSKSILRLSRVGWYIVAEVRFAYPCGTVKEKGEPADPRPELGPADGLDSRRKVEQRRVDLTKDLEPSLMLSRLG